MEAETDETMPSFRSDNEHDIDPEFTDDQLNDFQVCFNKFDKSNSGIVPITEIGSMIRASGLNPTERVIGELKIWLETNNVENISFEEFKKILAKVWEDVDQTELLKKAFDLLDPRGNGFQTVDQLKKILLNFGESLDEDDFKELLKNLPVQPDGTINHDDIIEVLATKFKPE